MGGHVKHGHKVGNEQLAWQLNVALFGIGAEFPVANSEQQTEFCLEPIRRLDFRTDTTR